MTDYDKIGERITDMDKKLGIVTKKCQCGFWFYSFEKNNEELCSKCLNKVDKNF